MSDNCKRRTVTFQVELVLAYPEGLDDDWVFDQYLSGPRFSINGFTCEPGTVLCASAGVIKVVEH
jgi:hypothetical protein